MNLYKRFLILFIAILGLLFYANAKTFVRVSKVYCIVHDPKTIQNFSCSVKPINRTTTFVNINGYLIRNVSNVLVNGQLFKKSEITYRPYLVNVTENYCDFFSKNKGSAYFRLAAKFYLPYTNLNHTCPYYGQAYLKDFSINSEKLPKFVPVGSYRLDFLISEMNYGRLGIIRLFGDVKEYREL